MSDEIAVAGNRRKKLKGLLFIVFIVVGMLIVQHFSTRKSSFHELLEQTAAELTKTCPQMIDRDMRLDNAMALAGNVLQYNYTFVNLVADSVDAELLQASLEPSMRDNAAKNPDLELFRKNKVIFIYNFKDRDGQLLMKVKMGPEKYHKIP